MYQFRFLEYGAAEIRIDDFVEPLECDHSFWSQQDYESQWKEAMHRVEQGLPAIFFASITAPDTANFFPTWICYPDKNELVFHEWIMFLDQLEVRFDIRNPHLHIPPYESYSDDGEPISEWRTSAGRE